ncbi:MAG: adenylate/guanylate cyclase domain-containing protein [Bacteroidia bacterium]|nr:adenylate/guanylate cyclase domain-containing protein [Bacteroidia bacterium]
MAQSYIINIQKFSLGILIFSCLFSFPGFLKGQDTHIEHLEELVEDLEGHDKLDAYNKLAEYYENRNLNKAQKYARKAVKYGRQHYSPDVRSKDYDGQYQWFISHFLLGKLYLEKKNLLESYKSFKGAEKLAAVLDTDTYEDEIEDYLDEIEDDFEGVEDLAELTNIGERLVTKPIGDLFSNDKVENAKKDFLIHGKLFAAKINKENKAYEEAVDAYKGAAELLKEKGDKEKLQEVNLQLAFLLDSLDKHEEARTFLNGVIAEVKGIDSIKIRDPEFGKIFNKPKTPEIRTYIFNNADQDSIRKEKKNLKNISERFARQNNFKKSLEYFKLYQELTASILADSLIASAEATQRENELIQLKLQKDKVDAKVEVLEKEREQEVLRRNGAFLIAFLILLGGGITYYLYHTKKREHKKLTIAYRDLEKTRKKLVGAEQKIVKLLKQHVSGDVAAELLSSNFNEVVARKFVCIMFLDIRDFTPMAEKMTPEELISYQNEVFGFMIDVVHKYNGNINQLLGDGFMASFGAPVSHGNDCQNAYHAAQEILQEVKERNEADIIPETKIGIGLHAGFVVTGNVGTEARKQYSITGNPVIIASRVEQLNKTYKSQFIITEEVFNKLEEQEAIKQPFLEVEVKGRSNPVKIMKLA